ncbi:ArsR/SmtB family transcription factor [Celerinatantimonas yamalensis]|uniref:Metalloregulator ArsR/SmtB family transcription factor n=1 Tax=Celerinatantimonas yamalensis TaxID=559956 RepID=A0ABW9G2D8_9GAMM
MSQYEHASPQTIEETVTALRHDALADVLHALGDPIRLAIIAQLYQYESRCSDLKLPISKSTLSHHIKILRQAGIIATRSEGTARISRLCIDALEERFPGLILAVLTSLVERPKDPSPS